MGSGECIDTLLSGQVQAHLTSPASAAFIKLGNAQSRVKTGKDLIGATENLVLSPVVIAMWKPMAEALGWGRNLAFGRFRSSGCFKVHGIDPGAKAFVGKGHPQPGFPGIGCDRTSRCGAGTI
jgi:Bacterial extracellular solute-binding protein